MTVRYYAQYKNDILHSVGIGLDGVEITKEEYNTLSDEIQEKATLEYRFYNAEITIDSIPTEWQEEIQRRVNDRIVMEGEITQQEVSGEEFMTMLEEVL